MMFNRQRPPAESPEAGRARFAYNVASPDDFVLINREASGLLYYNADENVWTTHLSHASHYGTWGAAIVVAKEYARHYGLDKYWEDRVEIRNLGVQHRAHAEHARPVEPFGVQESVLDRPVLSAEVREHLQSADAPRLRLDPDRVLPFQADIRPQLHERLVERGISEEFADQLLDWATERGEELAASRKDVYPGVTESLLLAINAELPDRGPCGLCGDDQIGARHRDLDAIASLIHAGESAEEVAEEFGISSLLADRIGVEWHYRSRPDVLEEIDLKLVASLSDEIAGFFEHRYDDVALDFSSPVASMLAHFEAFRAALKRVMS